MDFHDLLDCWEEAKPKKKAVLATVIAVEGHAYRKVGASMLIFDDGEQAGWISPGCLEADLMERVVDIIAHERPQVVEYDMRDSDDLAWGEAVGCGGSIHVLMEPIAGVLEGILSGLKKKLDCGLTVFLTRVWLNDDSLNYAVETAEEQDREAAAGQNRLRIVCEPRPRLIIFGAGSDAEPLVAMAKKAGFRVIVGDWREALCCAAAVSEAYDRVVGSPNELVERLQINGSDYVVIMSHQMERDRQCLDLLWPLAPRYVGLLGSKTRSAQLLGGRTPPTWLKSPVGLPIRAEGPVEIAISVVAELIAVKRSAKNAGKGVGDHERQGHRHLFGGRRKQAYGSFEAFYTARE
jgi:xanthine dehydrogenase accessory factor